MRGIIYQEGSNKFINSTNREVKRVYGVKWVETQASSANTALKTKLNNPKKY